MGFLGSWWGKSIKCSLLSRLSGGSTLPLRSKYAIIGCTCSCSTGFGKASDHGVLGPLGSGFSQGMRKAAHDKRLHDLRVVPRQAIDYCPCDEVLAGGGGWGPSCFGEGTVTLAS